MAKTGNAEIYCPWQMQVAGVVVILLFGWGMFELTDWIFSKDCILWNI